MELAFLDAKGKTKTIVGYEAKDILPLTNSGEDQMATKFTPFTSKELLLGVIKNDKVNVEGLTDLQTGAMIKLLSEDSNARLVSSPFLLSNSGEEASFYNGYSSTLFSNHSTNKLLLLVNRKL